MTKTAMNFTGGGAKLTRDAIDSVQRRLGLRFPSTVIAQYVRSNGGAPSVSLFDGDKEEVLVSRFLPLRSAVAAYRLLVRTQKLAPDSYFPFADDVGGDVLFVDCLTPRGSVHLYRHDTAFEHLRDLGIDFATFWNVLKPDPEE